MKNLLAIVLLILPLTVTVAAGQSEITGLYWNPVVADLDGNALDPADVGYRVYCSPNSGTYPAPDEIGLGKAIVPSSGALSGKVTYAFSQPPSTSDGDMYCAIAAFNGSGESAKSEEIRFLVIAGVRVPPSLPVAPSGVGFIYK